MATKLSKEESEFAMKSAEVVVGIGSRARARYQFQHAWREELLTPPTGCTDFRATPKICWAVVRNSLRPPKMSQGNARNSLRPLEALMRRKEFFTTPRIRWVGVRDSVPTPCPRRCELGRWNMAEELWTDSEPALKPLPRDLARPAVARSISARNAAASSVFASP